MNDNTLSLNLEYLIKVYGLSLNELSKKIGVPQPTLHRMLAKTTVSPRRNALESLAKFFNISIAQLTGLEPLPRVMPESIQKNLHVQEIPIISWELVRSWPLDNISLSKISCEKIILDKEVNPQTFALICNTSQLSPLFIEKSLLIFNPSLKPLDRNFVLVYFSDTDSIEFNRLFVDEKGYYLKQETADANIHLKKLNLATDRIIAVLIESRTTFN